MSFLTVEDVNSTLLNYGNINEFFVLDSSKLEFSDENNCFNYDFISFWREEDNNYYLDISNSLWTGGYYITDKDDNYLRNATITYIKGKFCYSLYFGSSTIPEGFKIYFYMSNYFSEFKVNKLRYNIINLSNVVLRKNTPFNYTFEIRDLLTGELANGINAKITLSNLEEIQADITNGKCTVSYNNAFNSSFNCRVQIGENYFYFYVDVLKDNIVFDLEDDLLVGAINTVKIITDQDLNNVKGFINVNGKIKDLNFKDEEFIIDLTGETIADDIFVSITVYENKMYYGYTHNFILNSHYFQATTFEQLKNELEKVDGASIIEITSEMFFNNRINVNHDVLLRSNLNNILTLRGHGFNINENINFKGENLKIVSGGPAFIQKISSSLEINNCDIGLCNNSNFNGLGSVIYCDIDADSLNDDDDFNTTINDCIFINNQLAIFHGGQLSIKNSKFRKTTFPNDLKNNPSFLYQVDGDAIISNCVFDIDYKSETFCNSKKNIGFNQCLVMCGESATINGATYQKLQTDNSLPFFNSPYNNKSHLFAKYYYPQIESCVFSSPVVNFEDESCCHAVTGVDWVFKNNVQITRADWNNENTKRIISW